MCASLFPLCIRSPKHLYRLKLIEQKQFYGNYKLNANCITFYGENWIHYANSKSWIPLTESQKIFKSKMAFNRICIQFIGSGESLFFFHNNSQLKNLLAIALKMSTRGHIWTYFIQNYRQKVKIFSLHVHWNEESRSVPINPLKIIRLFIGKDCHGIEHEPFSDRNFLNYLLIFESFIHEPPFNRPWALTFMLPIMRCCGIWHTIEIFKMFRRRRNS